MISDLLDRLTAPGPKRILALDGGGVRGALMLGFLEAIEKLLRRRYGRPDLLLCDYFDLIGGTSAGSILAASLATGMDTDTLTHNTMEFSSRIFGRRKWKSWEALFDPQPLQETLTELFGDITLDSSTIKTGLCIVTKRADTRSTWPLLNHPAGRYFKKNRKIMVRDAVYASAAAPYYFVPIEFDVGGGERGAFVDGGVSMAKNPALQLFLLATLHGYPFHWSTGEDQLSLLSIGTGFWQRHDPVKTVVHAKAWDWIVEVPTMLIEDANVQAQLLLQYLSRTPTPFEIDTEVGNLANDLLTSEPALSYIRYDTRLESKALHSLGIRNLTEQQAVNLRDMSEHENRDLLLSIGRAAAAHHVTSKHFRSVFDIA
jgi:Patatin-like phospholipase